jgi:hypothetical protein
MAAWTLAEATVLLPPDSDLRVMTGSRQKITAQGFSVIYPCQETESMNRTSTIYTNPPAVRFNESFGCQIRLDRERKTRLRLPFWLFTHSKTALAKRSNLNRFLDLSL